LVVGLIATTFVAWVAEHDVANTASPAAATMHRKK